MTHVIWQNRKNKYQGDIIEIEWDIALLFDGMDYAIST